MNKSAINKILMNYKNIMFLTALIFMLFSSCNVSKQTIKEEKQKKLRQISLKKLQNNVENAYLDFNYLQLKFSAKVNMGQKKYSLKGQMRIKKDSLIWMNLNHATGIPVAKMVFLPDTIKFLNRLNSEYFYGGYEFFETMFGLDINYNYFQSIFTNELFTYPDQEDVLELKKGNYKNNIDSNQYCLQSLKNRKIRRKLKKRKGTDLIVQKIYVSPETFKISDIFINEFSQDRTLSIKYSDHYLIDEKLFPEKINFVLKNDTNNVELSIKYTKITNNKKLKFPFKIPEKYTKIE